MNYEELLGRIAEAEAALDRLKQYIFTERTREQSPTQATLPNSKPIFPQELESLLRIEDVGNKWIATPTKFLGSDNFSKILTIAKEQGGQYIKSEGKAQPGHFEIPK